MDNEWAAGMFDARQEHRGRHSLTQPFDTDSLRELSGVEAIRDAKHFDANLLWHLRGQLDAQMETTSLDRFQNHPVCIEAMNRVRKDRIQRYQNARSVLLTRTPPVSFSNYVITQ